MTPKIFEETYEKVFHIKCDIVRIMKEELPIMLY